MSSSSDDGNAFDWECVCDLSIAIVGFNPSSQERHLAVADLARACIGGDAAALAGGAVDGGGSAAPP